MKPGNRVKLLAKLKSISRGHKHIMSCLFNPDKTQSVAYEQQVVVTRDWKEQASSPLLPTLEAI